MVSIIRSPAISEERRKLSTHRSRAQEIAPAAPPDTAAVPPDVPSQVYAQPQASTAPPAAPAPDMKALLAQARASVMAELKGEAEQAFELARQRGMEEGRSAGAEEAKKAFAAELTRLRSIGDAVRNAAESGIKGTEDIAVSIAFEAACKVLGTAAVTRDGIQALVREAAGNAINTERVLVRLHAGDLEMLRDAGALDANMPSGMPVSWIADTSIKLGGCVVETDSGELDARLETQIVRLRATLIAARGNAA